MESILVLAFTEPDGRLARPAHEAVTAASTLASALGATLSFGVIGMGAQAAAAGMDRPFARVLAVEGDAFTVPRYATDVHAAASLAAASGASAIVSAGTPRALRCLPGLAARLGGVVETHVTGLSVADGAVALDRWFYRQRIEATLTRARRPLVVAIEPGSFEPWRPSAASAATSVEALEVPLEPAQLRTTVVGVQAPAGCHQTIRPDAGLLFVAGAGWTKKQADGRIRPQEAERLILQFLEVSQASLGGSKSLVDLTGEGQAVLPFMTHMNQVGQTGSTPRHPKGLATCCHGEEPHVVGWRFVTERRAVNLNPNCGWAQGKADVLYVADAFAVLEALNALLARRAATSTVEA